MDSISDLDNPETITRLRAREYLQVRNKRLWPCRYLWPDYAAFSELLTQLFRDDVETITPEQPLNPPGKAALTWVAQLATLKSNPSPAGHWTFSFTRPITDVPSLFIYEDIVKWKEWRYVIPDPQNPNSPNLSGYYPVEEEWIYLLPDSGGAGGFTPFGSAARVSYDKIEFEHEARFTSFPPPGDS